MKESNFQTVIGLEVHAQLNTKSKMFCSCDNNAFQKEPNSLTCPICMGMPGTLPVGNREAILKTIKLGLALGCEIQKVSKFDRKHYFYPDLPKGYQISQYDQPFCEGGNVSTSLGDVSLNRVHLEEDAGKLVHPAGADYSFVDLNRAGTPLVEIVSEPDITSPAMAREYLETLRTVLRTLGVSDADMEKGMMRADANISVKSKAGMSEIVEIKNINSFRFVEKALAYEEKRLRENFEKWPKKTTKVTRGFNADRNETFAMREKEEAKDYRYFPEPDLPPFDLTADEFASEIEKMRSGLPTMPTVLKAELEKIGITQNEIRIIVKDKNLADKSSYVIKEKIKSPDKVIRILVNNRSALNLPDESLVKVGEMISKAQLSSGVIKKMVEEAVKSGKSLSEISESSNNMESVDVSAIVEDVIARNQDAVVKYKSGKTQVLGFLVGEAMREAKGKTDPEEVRNKFQEELKN